MTIDLGWIAVGILIGAATAVLVIYLYVRGLVREVVEELNQHIEQAEANLIGLDIEQDNGRYFCYNSEDKQFVCQGATVGEIARAFRSRYPDRTAYLAGGDPTVVEHFKTELTRLADNEVKTDTV